MTEGEAIQATVNFNESLPDNSAFKKIICDFEESEDLQKQEKLMNPVDDFEGPGPKVDDMEGHYITEDNPLTERYLNDYRTGDLEHQLFSIESN